MRKQLIQIMVLALVTLLPGLLSAQSTPGKYESYQPTSRTEPLFEIGFDKDYVSVTVFDGDDAITVRQLRKAIVISETRVALDDSVYFDSDGLHFSDSLYSYRRITDTRVTDSEESVLIEFQTIVGDTDRLGRMRRGNRMTFAAPIKVEEDEFVRGLVMSVLGDIEIYGEVNKDVISLFGDVYVGPAAVARGDIASITGDIDLANDASVYGELYSGTEYLSKRSRRFYRRDKNVTLAGSFIYNRVDGATPKLKISFEDSDSLLPTMWAEAGYAFASSRWRIDLGIEQMILRHRPLSIGGSYYRRLASEDNWLLDDAENTGFALLVTEDYKDYWEAEGGTAWVKFHPIEKLQLIARYRYEETNWRRSYRHLWSLFGGDKRFKRNFERVPEPYRTVAIPEIDTTANGAVSFNAEYDTRDQTDPFNRSAWHATGEFEYSHPDLSSDFDYRRYTLLVSRYQLVHRRSMVLLRAMFGGSDGYLPMYKRFYLGGLGTLRGYKHKEYMGSRFWMANAEYRIAFPKTDLAASLIYDVGQIANDVPLDEGTDVKHSLGVSLWIGDDFKVNLAKRLDRSYDDSPQLYVRFDHVF